MSSILKLNSVHKTFGSGSNQLEILKEINFEIFKGETVAIVGPSGSGKTTLLGLCAGLDYPSSGEIVLCGNSIKEKSEDEIAQIRCEKVGFVFQDFQLLPTLTALENVAIPAELKGIENSEEKAKVLLNKVGLSNRMDHYPNQLSGGEQQRVALARAFANEPEILFADEPTGNLDKQRGDKIIELLFELNQALETTLVIVTHDDELARKNGRIIRIENGLINEQL
jgi:putative ABC transport system ATP-binding protein